ncbi:MAG TPA: metalloregulator ArsR/SmtB family transcription factor [Candidatus Ozemobacteraceae bacterium]|mgnify:FL=1|nr:metalloregulator ArsR/SmtB family transcription factor [Candidatus Ozemobacteraceae bacterium]
MNQQQRHLIEAKTVVLKALAHPTRLYIIEELAQGEKCVCEFVDAVKADFSTVSKHLLVLKNAGLVEDEKRGQQVFYRLRMRCLPDFISCIGTAVADDARHKVSQLTPELSVPKPKNKRSKHT